MTSVSANDKVRFGKSTLVISGTVVHILVLELFTRGCVRENAFLLEDGIRRTEQPLFTFVLIVYHYYMLSQWVGEVAPCVCWVTGACTEHAKLG